MAISNAEKCKRRREKLKLNDPEKYARELADAKARNKARRELITAQPKDNPRRKDYLEKENQRQKKYQAQKQAKEKEKLPPPKTRQELQRAEQRREKNRLYKQASRARRSSQKKTADRKKDADRQRNRREAKHLERVHDSCTQVSEEEEELVATPVMSPCKLIREHVLHNLNKRRDVMSCEIKRQLKEVLSSGKSARVVGLSRRPMRAKKTLYKKLGNGKKDLVESFYEDNSQPDPSNPHRRQLIKPIKELFSEFKKQHPSVQISLRSFFRFRPKYAASVGKAKFRQCLCEICLNPKMKLLTVNRFLEEKYDFVRDLLVESVCDFQGEWPDLDCVDRKCDKCGVHEVKRNVEGKLGEKLNERVTWFEWGMVKEGRVGRLDRLKKCGSLQECLNGLFLELQPLYLHVFTADWQRRQLRDLKRDLPSGWALVLCDYSENFQCKMQEAAQSTYYSQKLVTLFPAVAFFQCPCSQGMKREEIAFFSDDLRHDAYLTQACVDCIVTILRERLGPSLKRVILASDGCAAQFKSKLPFLLFTRSVYPGLSVDKVFFGSRHGKNDSDWSGGAIKRLLNRHIAAGVDLRSAKDVYQLCADTMTAQGTETACEHKARQFHYLEQSDVSREIASSSVSTVAGCRRFHHLRSEKVDTLETRDFSCFCSFCIADQYDSCDSRIASSWVTRRIICEQHLESQESEEEVELGIEHLSCPSSPCSSESGDSDLAVDSAANVSSSSDSEEDREDRGAWRAQYASFFSSAMQRLTECCNFEELQGEAERLKNSVAAFPLPKKNAKTEDISVYPEDALAINLLPETVRGRCKPLQVYGDGNCFFRSLSFLVYGNEQSHVEMRVRTVLAMCLKEHLFLDAQYWTSPCTPAAQADAEQLVSLCIDSAHQKLDTPHLTFKRECLQMAQMNTYAGLWQFMAAAVALNMPVQSVIYSQTLPPAYLKHYNRTFRPLGCSASEKLRVMWTPSSPLHDIMNHLVPICLLAKKKMPEQDTIYLAKWCGKTYPCQILEVDELQEEVCVRFMSPSRGYWVWKDTDTEFSWEPIQNLSREVHLDIVSNMSTQRCQYYRCIDVEYFSCFVIGRVHKLTLQYNSLIIMDLTCKLYLQRYFF